MNSVGVESIGEKRVEESVDLVVLSGDLVNSVPQEEVLVNDLCVNSVEEKRSEVDDMVVNSVENLSSLEKIEGVDAAGSSEIESIKSAEENKLVLDSVENRSDSLENKLVLDSSVSAVSSTVVELTNPDNMVVYSVENSMASREKNVGSKDSTSVDGGGSERVDVRNSADEKILEESDMDVDMRNSAEEKIPEESNMDVDSINGSMVPDEEKMGVNKRMAENSVGEVLGGKKKKARVNTSGDMKRVAEIVLILSALGSMRGGRSPTDVEKEIMDEAKEKLVGLCESMAPKVIVPKDAIRVVIEDLGISRSRDQRLGFRPPMTSIKEKLQLSKRKMEESKKFAPQSGMYSSQVSQAGFVAKNENPVAFVHTTHRFQDRPNQIAALGGSSSTTSSTNQVVQSAMISRGPVSSPLERASSSPHTETVHFKIDGMSTYASQVRANSSGDHLLGKSTTCAPQPQLGAVAGVSLANKVPDYKVEGIPVMGASHVPPADGSNQSSNHSVTQSVYRNLQAVQQPLQGLSTVHNEIAQNVQKFLYPVLPQHPCWTPPSTDYMNKSLICQVCRGPITDVESVLICDACEKGNHTGCLRAKGIPKNEWHCPQCLQQSKGKPLPPKYGRVTRGGALNVMSNVGSVPSSAEKVEISDKKANHQKATANGHLVSLHPAQVGGAGNIHVAAAAAGATDMSSARKVQAAYPLRNKVKMDDVPVSERKSPQKNMAVSACNPNLGKPSENFDQKFQSANSLEMCELAEMALNTLPEARIDASHGSQPSCISQDVGKPPRPIFTQVSSDKYPKDQVPDSRAHSDVRKDGQDAAQTVSVGNSGLENGARDCLKPSIDGFHSIDWVGDILKVVDEKAFYNSCCINGMMYSLRDHALFCSNNGDLRPSKLQALWEDTKTGSKWAIVNSCYFPDDLPEVVGRPCSPEMNEVYESNHGSTVRAGLIHGPCEVLPPNKFKEESERRIHSDDRTRPVFLCKWFYDESKGLFRPVTD